MGRERNTGSGANGTGGFNAGATNGTPAIVVVPLLNRAAVSDDQQGRPRLGRSPEARHDEAVGLARAIDLDPVHTAIVNVADPRPSTLLGSGKVEEFAAIVRDKKVDLVIVDHPLTPVQQRNLEKELNAKVLDRTGLILEIFGRRARTKEGTLQVDLAHLNYQKGRLVRSWTHLERQRGGAGVLGIEHLDRLARHDGGNRMLVNKLRMTIPAQQHAEIVERRHHARQFYAIDQENGEWVFALAN